MVITVRAVGAGAPRSPPCRAAGEVEGQAAQPRPETSEEAVGAAYATFLMFWLLPKFGWLLLTVISSIFDLLEWAGEWVLSDTVFGLAVRSRWCPVLLVALALVVPRGRRDEVVCFAGVLELLLELLLHMLLVFWLWEAWSSLPLDFRMFSWIFTCILLCSLGAFKDIPDTYVLSFYLPCHLLILAVLELGFFFWSPERLDFQCLGAACLISTFSIGYCWLQYLAAPEEYKKKYQLLLHNTINKLEGLEILLGSQRTLHEQKIQDLHIQIAELERSLTDSTAQAARERYAHALSLREAYAGCDALTAELAARKARFALSRKRLIGHSLRCSHLKEKLEARYWKIDAGYAALAAELAAAAAASTEEIAELKRSLSDSTPSCIICYDETATMAFVHGGTAHLAACEGCAMRAVQANHERCPSCNVEFERIVRQFRVTV